MKSVIFRCSLALSFAISSNISFALASIAASPPPYPPACGSTPLSSGDKIKATEKLRANLGAHNYPVAAQAHHIFPLAQFHTPLGVRLCGYKVNLLDGVENGVWLPNVNYLGRIATLHSGRNTNAYIDTVTTRLNVAKNQIDALAILGTLKSELASGTLQINNAQ